MIKTSVAAFCLLASSSASFAYCVLYKDPGQKGQSVVAKEGACVVFDAGGTDFAECKGKTIMAPAGWNNSASSVRLDKASRVILYNHGWGGDKLFELKGNPNATADLKGGADNHTSLMVCE